MPTQLQLQQWLQAQEPELEPFSAPQRTDTSYVPADIRQDAGYDMSYLRESGIPVARAMQLLSLREGALKKEQQRQFEEREKKMVEEASKLNPESPTYRQDAQGLFDRNPEIAKSPWAGNILSQKNSYANDIERDRGQVLANKRSVESDNAKIEAGLARMGVAPANLPYLKNPTTGGYDPATIGNIENTFAQQQAELKKTQEIEALQPMLSDGEAAYAAAETTASKNMISRQYVKAQTDAGLHPSQVKQLIDTSLGVIPATASQYAEAKKYKPDDAAKASWLEANGIDVSEMSKEDSDREWRKAYKGAQDMRLADIVSGNLSKQAPPQDLSKVKSLDDLKAAGYKSGDIVTAPDGRKVRMP